MSMPTTFSSVTCEFDELGKFVEQRDHVTRAFEYKMSSIEGPLIRCYYVSNVFKGSSHLFNMF
jgi:hypothetical protein